MAQQELSGEEVVLKPVATAQLAKLYEAFANPAGQKALRRDEPMSQDTFLERLREQSMRLWEAHAGGKLVGFFGYRQMGRPYLLFHFSAAAYDVALVQDALLPLIHDFFQNGRQLLNESQQEDPLTLFLRKDLVDEMHGFLVENGFDPLETFPFANEDEAVYELSASTYDAYWGEGADELE